MLSLHPPGHNSVPSTMWRSEHKPPRPCPSSSACYCCVTMPLQGLMLSMPLLTVAGKGEGYFVHPIPLWRRRWMVVMFSLTASLLFSDQNLLSPNVSVTGLVL